MENKRLSGIDAVRSTAIIFVIILHSISLSGILDGEKGAVWGISLYVRQLTIACVPLFLMLSGYLQRSKKYCISYFCGIIPLYLSYIVISALCLAAYAVNGYASGNMDLTFVTAVYKTLNFSANGYAWYFEMYLGLFLLIPFLNMVYGSINTARGKRIMIGILTFLTLLPDTVSGFAPYYDGSGSTVALNVFPDFFKALYPVTFYYIGSYIAEFKPHLSVGKKLLAVVCAPLFPTLVITAFTYSRGGYAWYMFNGFQTLTVAFTAVAVFLALYDINVRPKVLSKSLSFVAKCTFEVYLLSYLWDNLFYTVLGIAQKLPLAVAALLVFVFSLISAAVLRAVLSPISKLILRFCGKSVADKELL